MSQEQPQKCRFCDATRSLETHHVVPKKYGGRDVGENTITVCESCHKSIEQIWDRRFYQQIGVRADMAPNQMFDRLKDLESLLNQTHSAVAGSYEFYDRRVEYAKTSEEEATFRAKRDVLLDLLEGDTYTGLLAIQELESELEETRRLIDYIDFEEGR